MSRPAADPVFRSARREALIVALVLAAAMTYTLAYCYRHGYGREAESLSFVLWFPDWVFWGIVAPWAVCTVFATWFAFRVMQDEDLGRDDDPDDGDDFPPRPLRDRRGRQSTSLPPAEGRGEGLPQGDGSVVRRGSEDDHG